MTEQPVGPFTTDVVRTINREQVVRLVLTGRLAPGVSEYDVAALVVAHLDAWDGIPPEQIDDRTRYLSRVQLGGSARARAESMSWPDHTILGD